MANVPMDHQMVPHRMIHPYALIDDDGLVLVTAGSNGSPQARTYRTLNGVVRGQTRWGGRILDRLEDVIIK